MNKKSSLLNKSKFDKSLQAFICGNCFKKFSYEMAIMTLSNPIFLSTHGNKIYCPFCKTLVADESIPFSK